jgi:hypothetical protein
VKSKNKICGRFCGWKNGNEYTCGMHKKKDVVYEKVKKLKDEKQKQREKENLKRRKQHKVTVERQKLKNNKNGKKGLVICDKKIHYRAKNVIDKRDPLHDGFLNINVCSSAKGIWKELSPMYLGNDVGIPTSETEDGSKDGKKLTFLNIESLWQSMKKYENESWEDYYETRVEWSKHKKGKRRKQFGKKANRNIPEFSYWKGKKLSYMEARKSIYCPLYAKYVVKTEAYKRLKSLLNQGYNLCIIGYDGRIIDDLKKEFNDSSKPFGHEIVLVCLLRGVKPWE